MLAGCSGQQGCASKRLFLGWGCGLRSEPKAPDLGNQESSFLTLLAQEHTLSRKDHESRWTLLSSLSLSL